jgi:hypothetical protein
MTQSRGIRPRVDRAEAFQLMVSKGFLPSVEYPGNGTPWPGVCLGCGQPGNPRYTKVQQGFSPCSYCTRRQTDLAIAEGRMLARDFQPTVPYSGAHHPWRGYCLKCGAEGSPTYQNIRNGWGACGVCIPHGFKSHHPGVFYVITDGMIVKGGVSNRPDARLREHAKQGLTDVLHVIQFPSGADALSVEREWMEYVRTAPDLRLTKEALADGYSEALYMHDGLLDFIDELVSRWTLEAVA